MNDGLDLVRSALSGMVWPAVPNTAGALALALQFQLEQTQWWPPLELERQQLQQLQLLLRHAHDALPFWRDRLDMAGYTPNREVTLKWLQSLPLITRADIQAHGDALLSQQVPREHGAMIEGQTCGSTGMPIRFKGTELTNFLWQCFTLRDHIWHERDLSGKLAAICIKVEDGMTQGWGPATDAAFKTGPCVMLNVHADIDHQLAWLQDQDPDYLMTHPSTLRALLQRARETGFKPVRLREARTFAEMLPPDLPTLCQEIWNVKLTDTYSAEEIGYIALQCPQSERYHVQAESLLVEILNQAGEPCNVGEIGRVVLTTLHNFAMPLIRYEIGDYAQAGAPCPCGRGLPVIEHVMGRVRDILHTPDGRR